LSDDGPLEITI